MNNSSYSKKTRQRLLDAAAESFQSLGYARTTTQAIATKAGVAEVTLFRHFGDKQKLFQAVVQQIGGGSSLDKIESRLTYELETDLQLISQHILIFFLAQQDAIRMLMFESIHFPEMREALAQNPRGMIQLLVRYFQIQMENGLLRKIKPQIVAQTFMSMVFGYAIGMEPINELLGGEIPMAEIIDEFVSIFLMGIRATE
jgi:AcrR family transcriptional regulator